MTPTPSNNEEMQSLRTRVAELEAQVSTLSTSNASLTSNNAALAHKVEMLLHQLYGKKAERRKGDHPELPFPGDEPEPPPPPHVDEAADDEYETVTFTRKKRGATRISKDLPRETIVLEVPEAERKCPCCGDTMQEIGREVSERIDFVPAVTKVIETVRPKYACKKHEECGVRTASLPAQPVAKGMATAGLIAHVLVAKYKDHLPLYRQSCIFARHGAEIPESTLGDWVRDAVDLLAPVVCTMRTSVLESAVVQSDDTPVLVLDPGHPEGRKRGFLWAYVGDRDEVVFDFTPGRGRDGPKRFLGDFGGILQADAYSGYDHLYVNGRIREAGCMAHGRRGFVKAEVEDKVNAGHALAAIRRLYAVEREANEQNLDPDALRELRQRESLPVLTAMKPWLVELKKTTRPKSFVGKAVGYFLNQWDALCLFTGDGRVAIDNNRVERQMRCVAVGRKNWLFAGSEEGGHRAATIYSLVCTCGLLGIEPWAYLKDVLQRIAEGAHPTTLTPRLWKAARTQAAPH
ncbi:MAG: IS66 family transposase [Planctomycetes bacterium]|nr:IS66 family transposase [Planctomycetota bacterium]MCC7399844.1 IS66 family transposase [Planctomycetota bacterium]